MMTTEQKKTVRAQVNAAATQGAQKAAEAAKTATGWGLSESWAKLIAGAIIGALCACGFLSSCSPLNVDQANVAHAIIEVMTEDK